MASMEELNETEILDVVDSGAIPPEKAALEIIISHSGTSHIQSDDDCVKAVYKLPFSPPVLSYPNQNETEEVIVVEDGSNIMQLQLNLIDQYRTKMGYYGPLKVSHVRLKVTDVGQEKELLKVKLLQVKCTDEYVLSDYQKSSSQSQTQDEVSNLVSSNNLPLNEKPEDDNDLEKKKGDKVLIETYMDTDREMVPINFGCYDTVNISKKAMDEFRKLSGVSEPLNVQRERVFIFLNSKEIPLSVLHLFSSNKEGRDSGSNEQVNEIKTTRKRGRPRGRGRRPTPGRPRKERNEVTSPLRKSRYNRKDISVLNDDNDCHISIEEDYITDVEEGGITSFGCETGIVVSGNSIMCDNSFVDGHEVHKTALPMLELQSVLDDMNATLNAEEIWKYLTQYAVEDNKVQGLVTQFNNESWLEVKRMSDFYQVEGEVLTDLLFKVVYRNDFSSLTYFLRGFSRLLKTGELSTANDINHIFQCMSRDRKLCLGLKPSPYQPSIESNNEVRQYFKDKGQFVSTPFDCLYSKSCHGIVRVKSDAPSSTFIRGSKTILGVHSLCRACAFLGKKMNQLIKKSSTNRIVANNEKTDKMIGGCFMPLLRQPLKKNAMSYCALKHLYTQSIQGIISNGTSANNTNGIEETEANELPAKRKKKRVSFDQDKGGSSKSNIGMSENEFLNMIDLQLPNCEGSAKSPVKKCNLCQFRAPTMLSLIMHMKGHVGALKEKCNEWEIQLSSKEALELHRKQMHANRSPVCAICQLDFTTNDQLFDHMNKHRNHLPFECPYCSHKLSNKEAYKKHVRLTHKITSVKQLNFNCKTCNIYFYTRDHVLLHRINQNHEGIDPFICKTCSASCITANEFRHHIMEHSEEEREAANLAICPECFKVFFSKYRLNFHLESNHSKVKKKPESLPKPEVPLDTNSLPPPKKKKNRGPYLRYLRANERYECVKCKRRFKTSKTLESHTKFAHAEKKANKSDYMCDLCGRKFNALRRLGNHMKIHSGNRPVFQCEECGQIYGKKTQVLDHIRIDHAEQVERHQQQQELIQVKHEEQFVDIQVQPQNTCIEGSASTSWSPIKSPFKVPTVEQTQEAVYSLLQLTDF